MKKLIFLLLTLSFTFNYFSISANAYSNNMKTTLNAKSKINAYIKDEHNQKIYLNCERIAKRIRTEVRTDSLDSKKPIESIEEMYQVEIPTVANTENISLLSSDTQNASDSITDKDKTKSAKGTLTIKYTRTKGQSPVLFKLTKVTGSWKDLNSKDKIKISSSGKLSYVCYGIGEKNFWKKQYKGNISVKSGFSKNTGFKYAITNEFGSMGATLTIPMSKGTRKWNFTIENYRW